MSRFKLSDDCSVNMDHIVSLERRNGIQYARLLSGSTAALKGVYPLAHELFQVSKDSWVNPKYVSIVETRFNKGEAYRAMQADTYTDKAEDYIQVRVETILGPNYEIWADLYELDEVDNLAEHLLDGETNA